MVVRLGRNRGEEDKPTNQTSQFLSLCPNLKQIKNSVPQWKNN
jgi:hypothetical protein